MSLDQLGEFEPELSPIPGLPRKQGASLARGRRAIQIVVSFFLGQGALQGIQLLTGLLLIRWLSIEGWAQFGLASGFQITVNTLMDLGISGTIIPLVGERRNDRALVGRYMRSARHLRNRMFWIVAPFAAIAFFGIMHKHNWSLYTQCLLLASVLIALFSNGRISYSSAPLFIFGRLREFYIPQTLSGILRFLVYVCLRFAGGLNAWTAAMLSALNATMNGYLLERESRQCIEWPLRDDPSTDRELLQYMLPATPAIIFSAFQSQISLFLITFFGQTTNIAQVAALSKLGQLFTTSMMTFNIVIIEPFVARLSPERLLRTYLGIVAIAVTFCTPFAMVAFLFPKPFLWLLGAKYSSLGNLVGWIVLAACISYLAGLIWIMNRSRRWLFWSGTIFEIVILLATQIAFIALVGVHTTREAVLFTFASSVCYMVTHVYVAVCGFLRGPRGG